MSRAPITKTGSERLRAELDRLKSVDRPRIIAAIAEARAHGDLKENAEYHAAREQQSFAEGRIAELEAALSTAEVIDISRLAAGARVVFGATVDLEDEITGDAVTYQIVGDLEADIKQRLIAVSSPIARALIGKSEGDSFEFTAPNGVKRYEITKVRYV
jgi:transcription elongation factor GreA